MTADINDKSIDMFSKLLMDAIQVNPEARPSEICIPEVHILEVRPGEVRMPEVRLNVRIRFPPLTPRLHAFPQPCEMFLVRHRLCPLRKPLGQHLLDARA
jgi:hypothetical protein